MRRSNGQRCRHGNLKTRLANNGVNPLTGEQIVTPYAVARTANV